MPLPFDDWRVIITTSDITRQKEVEIELNKIRAELEARVQARIAQLLDYNVALTDEIIRREGIENSLRESEEKFRQVAESIDQMLWLFNPNDSKLLYINPASEKIWGRSFQNMDNWFEQILANVHPEDQAVMRQHLQSRVADELEFRIVRPDSSIRWIRCRLFPLQNGQGKLYRLVGVAEDITEQKKTFTALVTAEQFAAAGKMAASLAHEINNPLQAAIGCLQLGLEQLEGGGDASEYLRVTAEALDRASRIVTQLRTLHQQGQVEEKVLCNLNDLLEKVLLLTKKNSNDNGVNINQDLNSALPDQMLMPNAMQQVFLNIVLNALDAMPDGGNLQVITSQSSQPPGTQVRFIDNGTGILPETEGRLFEPFYTTKKDSLGLGLYISQSIVHLHGGYIDAHSRGEGGSVFTVWLPINSQDRNPE